MCGVDDHTVVSHELQVVEVGADQTGWVEVPMY